MVNKHTVEELKELQNQTWERKILISQARIMEWYYRNDGRVSVSYSGGKDSTVLLYLVRQQFPEVPAVFVHTGLEYPEVVAHVRATPNTTILRTEHSFRSVIEKCGYPVISKDVALTIDGYRKGRPWAIQRMQGIEADGTRHLFRESLYKKWRFLVDAPFKIGSRCCLYMKERPLARYRDAGQLLPYVGLLATESRRRRDAWLKSGCNLYDSKSPRSAPLSFWTDQDILRYIYQYKIRIPSVYGAVEKTDKGYITTKLQRTGCMFCLFGCHLEQQPNRIQQMAVSHPKLYEYCLRDYDAGGLGLRRVMEFLDIPYEPIREEDA